jgi:hypothetical protein
VIALVIAVPSASAFSVATDTYLAVPGIVIAPVLGWALAARVGTGRSRLSAAVLMAFACTVLGAFGVGLAESGLVGALVLGPIGLLYLGVPAFLLLLVPATTWAVLTRALVPCRS